MLCMPQASKEKRAVATPSSPLGSLVFGAAVCACGLITLAWRDYNGWHQSYIAYPAAAAWILGGAAMLFRRSAGVGAVAAGAAYLVFALLCLPQIVTAPQAYISWGNFFEQFSLVTGAAIVYARSSSSWETQTLQRAGSICFGACTASFGLEQAFYLGTTAALVPTWLPPNQMFWAVATTIAFGLAALALLTGRIALLASRLLTLMIATFGLIVWLPLLRSDPRSHTNWSEAAETFAIAGVAWILADLLAERRRLGARHTR